MSAMMVPIADRENISIPERKLPMIDLKKQLAELPPIFGRQAIEQLMPGIISSKTLSNLHSMGKGPQFFKIGRRAFYQRESFIEWFLQSSRLIGVEN